MSRKRSEPKRSFNDLIKAYRNARRYRAGFHAVRPNPYQEARVRLSEGKAIELWEVIPGFGSAESFRIFWKALIAAEVQAHKEDRKKLNALRSEMFEKYGSDVVKKLKSRHIRGKIPHTDTLPTAKDIEYELGDHADQEAALRALVGRITKWGGVLSALPIRNQYEVLSFCLASQHGNRPRKNLLLAYEKARAFQLNADLFPDELDNLLKRKKVPKSRSQALPTTRLAKLLVGETVRLPIGNPTLRQPYETRWYADSNLVNKVATMLSGFKGDGVPPEDVPTWIENAGGVEACIRKLRKTR